MFFSSKLSLDNIHLLWIYKPSAGWPAMFLLVIMQTGEIRIVRYIHHFHIYLQILSDKLLWEASMFLKIDTTVALVV